MKGNLFQNGNNIAESETFEIVSNVRHRLISIKVMSLTGLRSPLMGARYRKTIMGLPIRKILLKLCQRFA